MIPAVNMLLLLDQNAFGFSWNSNLAAQWYLHLICGALTTDVVGRGVLADVCRNMGYLIFLTRGEN